MQADLTLDWLDKSRSGLEQGRLAAPGRPEQDEAIRRIHLETDLVGGTHHPLGCAVFQADAVDREQRLGGGDRFADRVALQRGVHVGQLPCSGLASWKK
ncbi:hypothetical protein D3C79_988100 [compost metagenome]